MTADVWRLALVAHRAGVSFAFAGWLADRVGPQCAAAAIEYGRCRVDGEAAPGERAADELSIALRTLWRRLQKVRGPVARSGVSGETLKTTEPKDASALQRF